MEPVENVVLDALRDYFADFGDGPDGDDDIRVWDEDEEDQWRYAGLRHAAERVASALEGRIEDDQVVLDGGDDVEVVDAALRCYVDQGHLSNREEQRVAALRVRVDRAMRELA